MERPQCLLRIDGFTAFNKDVVRAEVKRCKSEDSDARRLANLPPAICGKLPTASNAGDQRGHRDEIHPTVAALGTLTQEMKFLDRLVLVAMTAVRAVKTIDNSRSVWVIVSKATGGRTELVEVGTNVRVSLPGNFLTGRVGMDMRCGGIRFVKYS